MEIKTIYIAGLMKGLSEDKIRTKFNAMHYAMARKGYKVINPYEFVGVLNMVRESLNLPALNEEQHRKEILGHLLQKLSECDELHLMPCWQDSKGAQLERHFAQSVGIDIVYHQTVPNE